MKTAEEEKAAEAADKKETVKHRGISTTGGQLTRIQAKSFSELENIATILGKSDIVPKDMIGKPANIFLALMFGNEVGLSPAQALQNVMVVNGRPCLWGDAVMGLVENSNLQEWWKDEFKADLDGGTVVFTTKRKGRDPVTRTFSMKDAEVAGLKKKEGPWQTYPKRMLFHRARSWALRDVYPDVLKGIRTFEEERDVIDIETTDGGRTYAMPKERGAAPTSAPAAEAPKSEPTKTEGAPPPPAEQKKADVVDGTEENFRVNGGATTDLDGTSCYLVRDDQDPPTKYYHDKPEWHAVAKAAKEIHAYVLARWVEKPSKKGPIRWLTAFSLRS